MRYTIGTNIVSFCDAPERLSDIKDTRMTITYRYGTGLYINMTNRCHNDCVFCIRKLGDSVGDAGSLWLDREPTREEMLEDILKHDLAKYGEIVFCGYGEPTERLDDLLWLCSQIKKSGLTTIRVNTNGQSSLIAGYDTAPLFHNLVDKLSISLNAAGADEYNVLCKPDFGLETYQAVLDFAKRVKAYVPEVVFSVVAGTTDIDACNKVATEMGLQLRVR